MTESIVDFLRAIPVAAQSEFALIAYAICGVLFLFAGAKLRATQLVIHAIEKIPEKDRRRLIETTTNSVLPKSITAEQWIRNNRNKWLFLLAGAALILVATISVIALGVKTGPGERPPMEQAYQEIQRFFALSDAGDYAGAYSIMAPSFKETGPLAKWLELNATFRSPLGAVQERKDAESTPGEFSVGGTTYNGHAIMYFTKFENMKGPIRELVTLSSPGLPEPWRVAGYRIDVQPESVFTTAPEPTQ